jgi:hypothetical protein
MVGLGRVELPTSPLSGVRSSQLSYRPIFGRHLAAPSCGTSRWWSWSGSNRRPPECKSGALPAELQPHWPPLVIFIDVGAESESRPVGCRDHGTSPWPLQLNSYTLSGDPGRTHRPSIARRIGLCGPMAWSGTAVCYWLALYTQTRMLFTNSTHVLS